LAHFARTYNPDVIHPLTAIIAAAASHHRLLWIHPFLDGNGRVARLFTDAYLRRAGVGGHGLWTASRGLARQQARYLQMLAAADAERWDAYDGRGQRSARALADFCRFFLETCLDQVRYMATLLELDSLMHRIEDYAHRRASGGVETPVPPASAPLLREVLLRGEIPRGDVARVIGASERTARRLVALLLREGLLISNTPKGAIRLGFPVGAVEYYFPHLFPH
jgi:Fic family protein